jgi:osmotically-inducible protein OsmY
MPVRERSWKEVVKMTKTKDIRGTVEAELTFDPLVDATDITVKNVGGHITLNGWVPSYPQYLAGLSRVSRS